MSLSYILCGLHKFLSFVNSTMLLVIFIYDDGIFVFIKLIKIYFKLFFSNNHFTFRIFSSDFDIILYNLHIGDQTPNIWFGHLGDFGVTVVLEQE